MCCRPSHWVTILSLPIEEIILPPPPKRHQKYASTFALRYFGASGWGLYKRKRVQVLRAKSLLKGIKMIKIKELGCWGKWFQILNFRNVRVHQQPNWTIGPSISQKRKGISKAELQFCLYSNGKESYVKFLVEATGQCKGSTKAARMSFTSSPPPHVFIHAIWPATLPLSDRSIKDHHYLFIHSSIQQVFSKDLLSAWHWPGHLTSRQDETGSNLPIQNTKSNALSFPTSNPSPHSAYATI